LVFFKWNASAAASLTGQYKAADMPENPMDFRIHIYMKFSSLLDFKKTKHQCI